MQLKLMKFVGAATLGSAILVSAPVIAQSQSEGQAQPAQSQQRDDDKNNWGWMGLLGLIGLAGLRRKQYNNGDRTVRGTA